MINKVNVVDSHTIYIVLSLNIPKICFNTVKEFVSANENTHCGFCFPEAVWIFIE